MNKHLCYVDFLTQFPISLESTLLFTDTLTKVLNNLFPFDHLFKLLISDTCKNRDSEGTLILKHCSFRTISAPDFSDSNL
jgi:hypothetical protein